MRNLLLVLLLSISVSSLANVADNIRRDYTTPTKKLSINEYPNFADDLDFQNIELAIDRQLRRYRQKNLSGTVLMGGREIPQFKYVETLQKFLQVVRLYKRCVQRNVFPKSVCVNELNSRIANQFDVYAPDLVEGDDGYGRDKFALFTAYYTPTIRGWDEEQSNTPWAIYTRPEDESLARSSREEIDFEGKLKNRNLELFYTQDLFELYILQVEGGGRIETTHPDGSKEYFYLSYDGTNRKSWRFISHYMREKGYINNGSIHAQREFLANNPDKQREIYRTCPSYVYFKVTETPPLGNDAASLSDNRSIATDRNHYTFKGMLAFVQTRRLRPDANDYNQPEPDDRSYMEFSRFMLDQDTGGAIRGKARVDLYFGEDEYAERAAQHVHDRGRLYWLVAK